MPGSVVSSPEKKPAFSLFSALFPAGPLAVADPARVP